MKGCCGQDFSLVGRTHLPLVATEPGDDVHSVRCRHQPRPSASLAHVTGSGQQPGTLYTAANLSSSDRTRYFAKRFTAKTLHLLLVSGSCLLLDSQRHWPDFGGRPACCSSQPKSFRSPANILAVPTLTMGKAEANLDRPSTLSPGPTQHGNLRTMMLSLEGSCLQTPVRESKRCKSARRPRFPSPHLPRTGSPLKLSLAEYDAMFCIGASVSLPWRGAPRIIDTARDAAASGAT